MKILNILTSLYHVERNTRVVHEKKHQDPVFWVDINLAIRKGLTFYQTRSNAIILQGTLPTYCLPNLFSHFFVETRNEQISEQRYSPFQLKANASALATVILDDVAGRGHLTVDAKTSTALQQ